MKAVDEAIVAGDAHRARRLLAELGGWQLEQGEERERDGEDGR